jgi:hypothetical protein
MRASLRYNCECVPSCFLSYCRRDDERFVERLRDRLVSAGVEVWWDRVALRSRGVSFLTEIDDAIRSVDRLVLIVGPSVAESDYVQHELAVAEERCTVVVPVLRLGGLEDVPAALRNRHVFDFRTNALSRGAASPAVLDQLLTTVLSAPPPRGRVLGNIRALPSPLIDRSDAVNDVVAVLMRDVEDPVVIAAAPPATAVTGMSGLGKTVLATLVGRSCAVRWRFADGIVFVRIGMGLTPTEVIRAVRALLGDPLDPLEDEATSRARFAVLFDARRVLVVLDDVWSLDQIDPVVAYLPAPAAEPSSLRAIAAHSLACRRPLTTSICQVQPRQNTSLPIGTRKLSKTISTVILPSDAGACRSRSPCAEPCCAAGWASAIS